MKKIFSAIMIAFMMFSVLPVTTAYAEETYQENALDKMSDWAATIGKDGVEKDKVLAERKMERQRKHAEKKAAQLKKQAEKKTAKAKQDAKAAKKDMKKKFGV